MNERVEINETSKKAYEFYKNKMDSKIESQRRSLEDSLLTSYHSVSKSEAIAAYDKKIQYTRNDASFATAAEVRKSLERNIEELFGTYVEENNNMAMDERFEIDETSKRAYEHYKSKMDSKIEPQRRSLEDSLLNHCHSESKREAIAAYEKKDQYTRNNASFAIAAEARERLERMIEELFGTYAEENNNMAMDERVEIDETSRKAYELNRSKMDSKIESQRRSLEDSLLNSCHLESKCEAIAAYDKINQYTRDDASFVIAAEARESLEKHCSA
ncbi:uncharacterized protein LOC125177590 [Hyalella azteca]|uniref:Uncharacterized protein LOC125177590 n=1 Tax=Hyalella azteca TaxID=294128 RepID=A0A979FFQ8_HYAAZ|nr:uncharacterized protein LOC125177590 [Hyalella azteca]